MFEFKTSPYPHQRSIFGRSKDLQEFALLMEMGTGKSKIIIDTANYLYDRNEINGVLIIAPSGVERNWITDELPEHMDFDPDQAHLYQAKRASTKWHQKAVLDCIHGDGLRWLCMTYDAFPTKAGKKAAWMFLKYRRVLYVLDESTFIKDETRTRTKTILGSAPFAPYKRILSGTPITQGPFDIHSQVRFLNPDYWKQFGLQNFFAFKARFGVTRPITRTITDKAGNQKEREVKIVVGYRNVEKIHDMIAPISARVLKKDVLKDLPDKVYNKLYVDLSKIQESAYEEMKQKLLLELKEGIADGILPIVRLQKLQQILSNFVSVYDEDADEDRIVTLGPDNPRLDRCIELCESFSAPAIIWSRYTYDIDRLMERLGEQAVRYDGQVSQDERAANKLRFKSGDAKFFVGSPAAAARGLTLTEAQFVVYYSNSFNLEHRLQSEDRAHRSGQKNVVQYFDLLAPDTIDIHIVRNLRNKIDLARLVTGDAIKDWLKV